MNHNTVEEDELTIEVQFYKTLLCITLFVHFLLYLFNYTSILLIFITFYSFCHYILFQKRIYEYKMIDMYRGNALSYTIHRS